MKHIGAHVSAAGGVQNAPLNAIKIGASAFAFFTRNQRRWSSRPLDDDTTERFKENVRISGIHPDHIIPHDSYLINVGSPDRDLRVRSIKALTEEARRVEALGLTMLNLHPGAHPGETGPDAAFTRIAEAVDEVLNETESIVLVLENTAGMGNSAGYRFEHLSEIILRARGKDRIGVCIDTCHLFAAGYDIRTPEAFRSTFKRFDEMIGFRKLRAMHLNDSRVPLGSRRDRHANLGAGMLGLAPFQMIMQDKRFNDIPLVLETSDRTLWPEEILMLRNFERSDLRSHFTLKLRSFCGTTVKMLQNFEKYLLD